MSTTPEPASFTFPVGAYTINVQIVGPANPHEAPPPEPAAIPIAEPEDEDDELALQPWEDALDEDDL